MYVACNRFDWSIMRSRGSGFAVYSNATTINHSLNFGLKPYRAFRESLDSVCAFTKSTFRECHIMRAFTNVSLLIFMFKNQSRYLYLNEDNLVTNLQVKSHL